MQTKAVAFHEVLAVDSSLKMIRWPVSRVWWVFFAIAFAWFRVNVSFGEEGQPGTSLRLVVDLSDGSRIMGLPTRETIPFQSSLAKMNIPLKAISTIHFKNNHETVKISFHNGDQLQGVLNLDAIEVTTLFGKVSINMEHIASLRVSSNGPLAVSSLNGLILYFSFDNDEGELVTDQSDKENRGKVVGAKNTSDGKKGGAYRFDGTAGIHVSNLDFSSGKYTVSGWIRTDRKAVAEDWRMWIGKLHPSTGGPFELYLGDGREAGGGNGPGFTGWNSGIGIIGLNSSSLNFHDGKWHMTTATYEKGSQKLYADGDLVATGAYSGSLPSNSTDVVIGGMDFGPYHHPWIGDIDEVMIFNRALSAEEVKSLYDSQN